MSINEMEIMLDRARAACRKRRDDCEEQATVHTGTEVAIRLLDRAMLWNDAVLVLGDIINHKVGAK